jgi:copper oxidase (laccase) domain-containing protein
VLNRTNKGSTAPPPRAARAPAPPAPDSLTAALVAALRPMVEEVVHEVMLEFAEAESGQPKRELVDSATLAIMLDVCTATVLRLARQGMPRIMVGEAARYRPAACIAWLEARGRAEAAE